jgi:hypothetical protein
VNVCVSDLTRDWSVCQANNSDIYELLLVAGGGAGSDFETYAPTLKDTGMCMLWKCLTGVRITTRQFAKCE